MNVAISYTLTIQTNVSRENVWNCTPHWNSSDVLHPNTLARAVATAARIAKIVNDDQALLNMELYRQHEEQLKRRAE